LNKVIFEMNYSNYDEFMEKYGWEKNPEYFINFDLIAWSFEGIGVMLSRKLIDATLVNDLIGGGMIEYWDKAKPFYHEFRRRFNLPSTYEYVDYLYEEIKPLYDKKHPRT